MRTLLATLVVLSLGVTTARAQTKQQLVDDWERQRANMLA